MKKETIRSLICSYTESYPKVNAVNGLWKTPLVRFADALDPRFSALKEIVAPDHLLPSDLVRQAGTVVAYFLPFIDEVSESNMSGKHASPLWAEAYVETNKLIASINEFIKTELAKEGFQTGFVPPTAILDPQVLKSNWSHRHVAVIAGLGTFGINNILITERGCCGRLGTFVTDLKLEADPLSPEEYCVEKAGGRCGLCQSKCVKNTFEKDEFNRFSCFEMCLENGEIYKGLGNAWVCGKCLVGLPCSVK